MGNKKTIHNTPNSKKTVKKTESLVSTPKLTPKQEKFCKYLASGLNATQAAIKAGYSARTARFIASENLTKPHIKSVTCANAQKEQEKFEYTKETHFKELNELEELARNTGNVASAIKAAELKGKLCGLYIEKQEIKAQVVSGFAVEQFLEKFNAKH